MSLILVFTMIGSVTALIISIIAYKKKEPKYLVGLIFIAIWLYFMASSHFETEKYRNILKNLKTEEVVSISIGNITISDKSKISEIVKSLRANKAHTPSARNAGKQILFKIKFKKRKEIYFNIAYLKRNDGVILRFLKIYENGERSYGNAFSKTLNSSLMKAGVDFKKMSER